MEGKIRIAGTVGESIVDGPGFRYTLFVQGCPHGCPGCHNPQTHDFEGGQDIELDGDPTQNLEAFEAVVRAMKEAGIGYGAINHPIDRDPVCGYTGIIGEVCPRCGRREGEGVPLSKLQKLGLYKNYNSTTIGYHGDPAEEADRQPNTLKIVKK